MNRGKLLLAVFCAASLTGCAKRYTQEEVLAAWLTNSGNNGDVSIMDAWTDEVGQEWLDIVMEDGSVAYVQWNEKEGYLGWHIPEVYSSTGVSEEVINQLYSNMTGIMLLHRGCEKIDIRRVDAETVEMSIDGAFSIFTVSSSEDSDIYVEGWEAPVDEEVSSETSEELYVEVSDAVRSALGDELSGRLRSVVIGHCTQNAITGDVSVVQFKKDSCVLDINGLPKAFQFVYAGESADILQIQIDDQYFIEQVVTLPYLEKLGFDRSELELPDSITYFGDYGKYVYAAEGVEYPLWFDKLGNVATKDYTLSWNTENEYEGILEESIKEYVSAKGVSGEVIVTVANVDYVTLVVDGDELHLKCAVGVNTPDSEDDVLYLPERMGANAG